MLSYLGGFRDSVGPRPNNKDLPTTPVKPAPPSPPSSSSDETQKPSSPTQVRLEDLERKLAALTSQHVNLSHVMSNLEGLLLPNPATEDVFTKMELEKKLEEVKRERTGVEKEKMEVGILITRLRRKLDDVEGRRASDSFIWSRKWGAIEE